MQEEMNSDLYIDLIEQTSKEVEKAAMAEVSGRWAALLAYEVRILRLTFERISLEDSTRRS